MSKNQDYKNENYDRLAIWIKKGMRDEYKLNAAQFGISLAVLVQKGVEEYIRNHGGEVPITSSATESISAEDKRLLENLNSLPKSTRSKFTGLLEDFVRLAKVKGGGENGDN